MECRKHMMMPGRAMLLLSMLGVALSAAAHAYLKKTEQGLKHFLSQFPKEFVIDGAKGSEHVKYLVSQEFLLCQLLGLLGRRLQTLGRMHTYDQLKARVWGIHAFQWAHPTVQNFRRISPRIPSVQGSTTALGPGGHFRRELIGHQCTTCLLTGSGPCHRKTNDIYRMYHGVAKA